LTGKRVLLTVSAYLYTRSLTMFGLLSKEFFVELDAD